MSLRPEGIWNRALSAEEVEQVARVGPLAITYGLVKACDGDGNQIYPVPAGPCYRDEIGWDDCGCLACMERRDDEDRASADALRANRIAAQAEYPVDPSEAPYNRKRDANLRWWVNGGEA